jgi:hypothetical protein
MYRDGKKKGATKSIQANIDAYNLTANNNDDVIINNNNNNNDDVINNNNKNKPTNSTYKTPSAKKLVPK